VPPLLIGKGGQNVRVQILRLRSLATQPRGSLEFPDACWAARRGKAAQIGGFRPTGLDKRALLRLCGRHHFVGSAVESALVETALALGAPDLQHLAPALEFGAPSRYHV